MVADNPVDIVVAHVGQCNIVSLQEGQTRIVILKIQGGTHSRRHLIDEAENAVVAAGTVLIHELVLECDADFLVILFFDFQVPFLAVLFPDREFQIRVVGLEVVIEDVLDDFPVHAEPGSSSSSSAILPGSIVLIMCFVLFFTDLTFWPFHLLLYNFSLPSKKRAFFAYLPDIHPL